MKETLWDEITLYTIKAVQISSTSGRPLSITINSSNGTRTLIESQKGNWYWRTTGKQSDGYAHAYIVRDKDELLRRAIIEGHHSIISADGIVKIL